MTKPNIILVGRVARRAACAILLLAASQTTLAEMVTINMSAAPTSVVAGTTFSFPVTLTDNFIDTFTAYSLDVDVIPDPGATGSMTGLVGDPLGLDPGESNFHLVDNFIEADPTGSLNPVASVINDGGDGGVFVRGFELTLAPVGPAAPGHDVLAELFFDVSPDALGFFTLALGPGTELLDDLFAPAPYNSSSPTIEVVPVPEPSFCGILLGTALFCRRTRRRNCL